MLKRNKGVVSIWLGTATRKKLFGDYFKESYGDDKSPINAFAKDSGASFYDHDFVEGNWAGPHGKSVRALLSGHSYGDSFAELGAAKAKAAGIETATYAFVMYDIELQPAKWPTTSPVQFVGTVPYEIPFDTPDVRRDDHRAPINECFVTSDGRFGVTTCRNAELRLWNLKSGKLIASAVHPGTVLEDQNNWVKISCSAPSSKRILAYRDWLVFWEPTAWGLKLIQKVASPHRAGISDVLVSANGQRLITSSFDKTLAVWRLPAGKPAILSGHCGRVYTVAWLPGGKVLSQDDEGEFRTWELNSATTAASFRIDGCTSHTLRVLKDGKTAVVGTYGRLLIVDLTQGKIVKELLREGSATLWRLAVTADERLAVGACVGNDGKSHVGVWDLRTWKRLHRMAGHQGEITGLATSQDGRIAVTVSIDANLIAWDLRKGKELARFRDAPDDRAVPASYDPDGYSLHCVAIDPAAGTIIAGEYSGRVRILKRKDKSLTPVR